MVHGASEIKVPEDQGFDEMLFKGACKGMFIVSKAVKGGELVS